MANEFIIRKGFQSQANSQITGSLIVTAGITGSFSGSVAAPGATTQVVYNSGGILTADSGFVYSGSNIGIGTTSPGYKLDVRGTIFSSGSFGNRGVEDAYRLKFFDNGGTANDPGIGLDGSGGAEEMWFNSLSGFYWATGTGGEKMRITSAGNVGIGTSSPSYKLDVSGSFRVDGTLGDFIIDSTGNDIYLTRNGANYIYANQTNSALSFLMGTGLSQSLFLKNDGSVGIGTNSPNAKLDISGSLNISGSGVQVPLQVYSGSTPLLFVSQSGNVGIGTTTPYSKFTTLGTLSTTTSQISIVNSEGGHIILRTGISGLTNSGFSLISADVAGTNQNTRLVVSSTGDVGIGTTTPNSKLNVSGSVTITGSLNVSAGITGSLLGTASYASAALSSSYALSASYSLTATSASFASTASIATSSSYALSASFAPAGNPFPFSGSALITGSLGVTGSVSLRSGSNLTVNNGLISASYGTNNVSVGGTPGWTSALRNTAFGISTQGSVTTQTDNTSVGYLSLLGGTQNTAVGVYASQLNTGTGNVAMGYYALGNQTSNTSYNTAIGYQAMYNASGSGNQYNVAIGYNALYANTTGTYNVAIGSALGANTTGYTNVAIAVNALGANTTGYRNIALGNSALVANTTGFGNIALGYSVLQANISGQHNIALGHETLYFNSLGSYNIALGIESMLYMRTGSDNIAIGRGSMRGDIVQGINRQHNIAIGQSALASSVYGNSNTAIGTLALSNAANTTASATFNGGFNTALGSNAGRAIHTGIENITIGYRAGDVDNTYYNSQNSGSYNIFIGSLSGNTVGAFSQSFGEYNIGIGYYTNYQLNNNGPYNVSLGDFTHSRLSSSAATRNTSIGSQAGRFITSGFRNTSLGTQAGYNITTGSYNILIGDSAGLTLNSGSNNTIIGSISAPTTSSTGLLLIGAGSTSRIYIDATGSGYISGSLAYTGSLLGTSSYASATNNIGDAISNNTDDYLLTATGGSTINGESNLTFGGSILTLGGGAGITLSGGGNIDIGGGQLNGVAGSAVNVDTVNASVKNFDIKHPTPALKDSHRLRYSSLEGPEISVYIRGRLTNNNTIELPHYWVDLVHENSITVNLTSIGNPQELYVTSANNKKVTIEIKEGNIDCYYIIYGERKDVNKLVVEYIKE